jgi:two-component system sensor kinase FixL
MPVSQPPGARSDQRQALPVVARAAAYIVFILGVAQILFWSVGTGWLETVFPRVYDMKFNTALTLVASGAGLFCLLSGRNNGALAAGTFVLAIGALSLSQHLTGVSLGIDQLFFQGQHGHGQFPGRISPGTSLALTLAGGAILLLARAPHTAPFLVAGELIGFAVFALGAGGAVGYILGVEIAYNWGSISRMAPHTSFALMTIGTGILALSWDRQDTRVAQIPLWVPAMLCFLVLLLDVSTPRGVATSIAYIPLVFCGLWFQRPHATFVFAAIATLLSIAAVAAKAPSDVPAWFVVANRALAIAAIWLVAALIYMRGKSETAFRTSDSKLRAIVNHTVDGLITIDAKGTIDSFNPACERIFGYTAEEVIGQNIKILMPEPYRAEHDGYLAHHIRTGEARIIGTAGRELTAQRKDGTTFPIDLSISAFDLNDRRHFSGIMRDITKRKEAEKQMALLASIVESSGDAVIGVSLTGRMISWNAGAQHLFGYTADEAIGRDAKLLVPPKHAERDRDMLADTKTGNTVQVEVPRLHKDGKQLYVSLTLSPVRDAHGAVVGASMVARDITARKKAEEDLVRHTQALERSNKDLDDFAYIASHDLKEPLRGLSNNASFLREDYADKLDADGVQRLNRMNFLTRRLDQLISDLLYFSRIGRQDLAVMSTDLNAVVEDIQALMETTLSERNAKIAIPKRLPTIVCDKPRTTEVFRNLITNAVKYNTAAAKVVEVGHLDILVTLKGLERDVFYVKDNGIGIHPDFHEDIFRIFKRLNDEDEQEKGTGAGLTFVRKIVERHGGRVWVDSAPGAGSTFYFTMKKAQAHAAA